MSKLAPVVGVCVSVRPSVPCMTNRSPWNACQCQLQLRNNSSPWYTVRLDMTQIRDIGHIRRRMSMEKTIKSSIFHLYLDVSGYLLWLGWEILLHTLAHLHAEQSQQFSFLLLFLFMFNISYISL